MPPLATLVVVLAVAAMVALGLWQLERRTQKEALLARYATNQRRAPILLPPHPDDRLLFRQVRFECHAPTPLPPEAGRAADASSGWRVLYACAGGVAVQAGVAAQAIGASPWSGGPVAGYLTHRPQHRSILANALSSVAPDPMVMASVPLPGLKPNPPANLADVPNNHLAYAVQWFLFAAIALVIYAVAVRRRIGRA